MDKWTWHMDTDLGEGKVNAEISSEDGKSKLKMANAPGKLVDTITSLLNSSYKWGLETGSAVTTEIREVIADQTVASDANAKAVEGFTSPLASENAELVAEQKQTIANLRREVTNLKKLLPESK